MSSRILDSAPVVATGEVNDIQLSAAQLANADSRFAVAVRTISYFDSRRSVRTADGRWVELPVPVDADIMGLVGDHLTTCPQRAEVEALREGVALP